MVKDKPLEGVAAYNISSGLKNINVRRCWGVILGVPVWSNMKVCQAGHMVS